MKHGDAGRSRELRPTRSRRQDLFIPVDPDAAPAARARGGGVRGRDELTSEQVTSPDARWPRIPPRPAHQSCSCGESESEAKFIRLALGTVMGAHHASEWEIGGGADHVDGAQQPTYRMGFWLPEFR